MTDEAMEIFRTYLKDPEDVEGLVKPMETAILRSARSLLRDAYLEVELELRARGIELEGFAFSAEPLAAEKPERLG